MNNIISNKKEEITDIKKSKRGLYSKSSLTKKINESIKTKKYHFKVLFTFQNVALVNYIFINLFFKVISKEVTNDNNKNRKLELSNEIKIRILGKGDQYILNSGFSSKCTEITINDKPGVLEENNMVSNLENEENIIVMKWDYKLTNCRMMFMDLTNLIEIDLSNFDASELQSMSEMFNSCKNLKSVIIGKNFDSLKLKDMSLMFRNCESLISLDLTNLNTKSSTSMSFMFQNCFSLNSLNIINFDTSSVISMASMFINCYSLVSLNLSNFNTFTVTCFSEMFSNCVSLKTLNISNFDFSNTILIHRIFYNCSSLTSLDLGNFNISLAMSFAGLFYGCKELRYLNLSNLEYSSSISMDGMFCDCYKLVSIDLSN